MPDKSHAASDGLFALPHHRLIALTGRDALAFAQAQFMNDVSQLHDGQWQWNGWLTPKGRVIALFVLLRLDAESLWLVVPDADTAALAGQLKRYVFRSKVAISVRDDLQVAGRFAAPLQASGNASAGDSSTGLEMDMSGEGQPRTLVVTPAHPVDSASGQEARWAAIDLRLGLPRLPASQVEHWTPQQLSLDRLKAFSVKKGCYPGQEIVARTHFLGKAKRGLLLVKAHHALEAGAELRADGSVAGPIVASAPDGTAWLGLAVVPLGLEEFAALSVDGRVVTLEAFGDGLAR